METEQEILNFIGKGAAYCSGSAAIAFLFFRFLGSKWIESKFAERMAAYKHAQAKELEEIRFQINSLFNRASKLHDKEYEVIPVLWGELCDVMFLVQGQALRGGESEQAIRDAIGRFIRTYHRHRIFLSPELKKQFFDIFQMMNAVLGTNKVLEELRASSPGEYASEKQSLLNSVFSKAAELEEKMSKIDELIQNQLYPQEPQS